MTRTLNVILPSRHLEGFVSTEFRGGFLCNSKNGNFSRQLSKLQDHKWEFSRPPLAWAVSCGLVDVTEDLLRTNRSCIEDRDVLGKCALHECCAGVGRGGQGLVSSLKILTLLLDAGAHVDASSSSGQTAMHYLLSTAPDTNGSLSEEDIASIRSIRLQALHKLLDWGASPNLRDLQGLTSVHYCAKRDIVDCLALILNYKANIYCLTSSGSNVLHLACQANAVECVELLSYWEADAYQEGLIGQRDRRGRLPLQLFSASKRVSASNLWLACRKGDYAE